MAWSFKRDSARTTSQGDQLVEVYRTDAGLLVQGSPSSVENFVEAMIKVSDGDEGRSVGIASDALQGATTVAALLKSNQRYFQFSNRALNLLQQHGAIPSKSGGYFMSMVHDGKGFAGNLDWAPVNISPDQLLNVQMLAVQLAIRSAVMEITAAIERVEGKVDTLVKLAESERLGHAVGDYETLLPVVERIRERGTLSNTDWDSVQELGREIRRDVEALRDYIRRSLKDVKKSSLVAKRVGEAKDLADELMRESLALLVVVEENYLLWQEIRLARARSQEPDAVPGMIEDVERQLRSMREKDQALATEFQSVIDELASPSGFEGLAPLGKQRLAKHIKVLDESCAWFCEQRCLDWRTSTRSEFAELTDSLSKVVDTTATLTRKAKGELAGWVNQRRSRRGREDGAVEGDD